MARTAASLDAIGGGRFELGLGGGAFAAGIAGLGAERRSPGESVDEVEEGIDVIRLMWSDERSVSFAGRHYRLDDARPGPPAAHPIGLWLGAFRPRILGLAGRKGNGWLPSLGPLTPQELREGNKIVDGAAEAAGRDPHDVHASSMSTASSARAAARAACRSRSAT
ncbi:MAG: LLM class flavin-dependent oxidoreductase [Solirubrobacteraceae bacterium]